MFIGIYIASLLISKKTQAGNQSTKKTGGKGRFFSWEAWSQL